MRRRRARCCCPNACPRRPRVRRGVRVTRRARSPSALARGARTGGARGRRSSPSRATPALGPAPYCRDRAGGPAHPRVPSRPPAPRMVVARHYARAAHRARRAPARRPPTPPRAPLRKPLQSLARRGTSLSHAGPPRALHALPAGQRAHEQLAAGGWRHARHHAALHKVGRRSGGQRPCDGDWAARHNDARRRAVSNVPGRVQHAPRSRARRRWNRWRRELRRCDETRCGERPKKDPSLRHPKQQQQQPSTSRPTPPNGH